MSWLRPTPVVGDATSAAERRADPTAWRFSAADREALYAIVAARRDIRRFRPDPLDPKLVRRVLSAAHTAPSVGHSQPWRFVLVSDETSRERAAVIAERERLRQAGLLDEDSARRMRDLKLDGIRDAPIGIVVCCDRRAHATGVLGRATFPDADMWSCAMAAENLWLAARAEGLGLGWVTLFPPGELAALVELPDGVATLGWLCLGSPDERPPSPGLERAGWSQRLPLGEVVLAERWEGAGPERPPSRLRAPTQADVVAARDESDLLLTSPGSLGVLDRSIERLGALGISGVPAATLVLAGADHPVARHRVSTYPTGVTREVIEASLAGESLGAAAARAVGMGLVVVDAGVNGDPVPGALVCRALGHRGDLLREDALKVSDVVRLIDFGRQIGGGLAARSIV
ncbi:MAG: 5,6-dimethylbenzimidazole synthase, partial [Thermoplasmata archaeon]